ncbi:hypothetical protein Gpo141_00005590 [Globisporangium polare]
MKPEAQDPNTAVSSCMLHNKTAIFDNDKTWAGSVNWTGNGMQSGSTVFVFGDPNANIIQTTMKENAETFIPITLRDFDKDHKGCAVCGTRLSDCKKKHAALALEKQLRQLEKRKQKHAARSKSRRADARETRAVGNSSRVVRS